jgi:hypothetical protein
MGSKPTAYNGGRHHQPSRMGEQETFQIRFYRERKCLLFHLSIEMLVRPQAPYRLGSRVGFEKDPNPFSQRGRSQQFSFGNLGQGEDSRASNQDGKWNLNANAGALRISI